MTRSILITGAQGQLGHMLTQRLAVSEHRVSAPNESELDITNIDQLDAVCATVQPDVVIHTAAATAVDWCEDHEDAATLVNVTGTQNVIEAATTVGAKVVLISTDYVFDGTSPDPYVETDIPNPLSVYGRTKLAAEQLMRPSDLIVRTSWLYSAVGNNIFVTLAKLAQGDNTLTFVNDQYGHPTSAVDLAERIIWCIDHDVSGIVHATNSGAVSWYEYAREVFTALGADPDRIEPVATTELQPPRPAPRPRNSVLDNAVLASLGAPLARDFRDTLAELAAELSTRYPKS